MNLFVGKERKAKTQEVLKRHEAANKELLSVIEEHLDPETGDDVCVCKTPQMCVTFKTPRLLKAVK